MFFYVYPVLRVENKSLKIRVEFLVMLVFGVLVLSY